MSVIPPNKDQKLWQDMLQYLDGTLPEESVRLLNNRLREDLHARELFEDLLLQQIKLKEIMQEQQVAREAAEEEAQIECGENIVALPQRPLLTDQVMAKAERKAAKQKQVERMRRFSRGNRWMTGLAMAASLAFIGVAVWLFLLPSKIATLTLADDGVLVERGRFKLEAEAGMALRVGDRVTTPGSGRAMFSYDGEATDITLDPNSGVGIEVVRESKQLNLTRGALAADVAKQNPDRALSLVTPQTEAVVVGTRFKLSTENETTRLEVFEGAVRVMKSMEGPSMHVPAGHFVDVAPGRVTTLLPLPGTTGSVQLKNWNGGSTNAVSLNELMFSGVGVTPGGSRVRGYLHPPLSGAYFFGLNANGRAELKISESENPSDARSVVEVGFNNPDTLVSDAVLLQAGRRYYFELTCETTEHPLNFVVSWTMPGGMRRVVYGEHLSPFSER